MWSEMKYSLIIIQQNLININLKLKLIKKSINKQETLTPINTSTLNWMQISIPNITFIFILRINTSSHRIYMSDKKFKFMCFACLFACVGHQTEQVPWMFFGYFSWFISNMLINRILVYFLIIWFNLILFPFFVWLRYHIFFRYTI